MAEEFLRAYAEYWREMELLSCSVSTSSPV